MQLAARHPGCLTGDTDYTCVERNSSGSAQSGFQTLDPSPQSQTVFLKWCFRMGRKKCWFSGCQRQNYFGVVSNVFIAISNGLGVSVSNLTLITLGSQSSILLIVKSLFGLFFPPLKLTCKKQILNQVMPYFCCFLIYHQKIELRYFKVTSDLLTSVLLINFTQIEQR